MVEGAARLEVVDVQAKLKVLAGSRFARVDALVAALVQAAFKSDSDGRSPVGRGPIFFSLLFF